MRKIIYSMVLICIMVVLSACSSSSKQEPASNPTSVGGPSVAEVQPGGEVVTAAQTTPNDQLPGSSQIGVETAVENTGQENTGQENTESEKSGAQQEGVSVPDNTGQLQPENNIEDKAEDKAENEPVLPAKVYVFTNNSGCCEATRQYYDQHRDKVKELENKYGSRVSFIWLDSGSGDVAHQKQLMQYASQFGVKGLPSVVVVDANDNVLINQAGSLNMPEFDRVFGGLK